MLRNGSGDMKNLRRLQIWIRFRPGIAVQGLYAILATKNSNFFQYKFLFTTDKICLYLLQIF
jgi:hypothetical protein